MDFYRSLSKLSRQHRDLRRASSSQGGFAIVELLVSLLIAVLVIGVTVSALAVTRRSNKSGEENLTSSNSAFQAGSRFGDDVASVGPVSGVTQVVATGEPGCGGTTSALRLIGPRPDGTGVQVRSYHQVTDGSDQVLRRRSCAGSNLSAALAASPTSDVVIVSDLATGSGAVQVTCDGAAVSASCQVVEMAVDTATGRSFTVRGSVASVLSPTPTTTPVPVVAPVTGTCTIMASETTWGGTGGVAGSGNGSGGDALMYTYNDLSQRMSFLRFDLTQPCAEGASGDWLTLPGGRNITAAKLYLTSFSRSGINYDQVLAPLAASSTWTEAGLTGANMPMATVGGSSYEYTFKSANNGVLTEYISSPITETVKQWYKAGGWVNNGWILRRSGAGDGFGYFYKFASRHNPTVALRPKLVVSWGP